MKKLLSLLSILTISGTSVPTTIAASPYQKEETIKNSNINYLQTNNLEKLNRNKRDVFSWIGGAITDAGEWVGTAAKDTVNWVGGAAESAFNWTKTAIIDGANWTVTAVKDGANWTATAISDASNWTITAVKDGANWTWTATSNTGKKCFGTVKDVLETGLSIGGGALTAAEGGPLSAIIGGLVGGTSSCAPKVIG
ncbi:hypothetical protein [Spiroplasma endosymbiont of Phyllotreta cruciferae]|uniref:hypothetical protein n=1 Tax=Spiroplasma endosymbiont of Phyllotreta cruciferae TaxID=2886375 RepID=UPI00209D8EAE|nr:hypothetical protein [Spiroplasma endosymbiont of Phyllotreta cruciferae]